MRLERWEEGDHELPADLLRDMAVQFWELYDKKRTTLMPGHGDRRSMDLSAWALMFQERFELEHSELDLLYDYMIAVDLIPAVEKDMWQDALDTKEIFYIDRR